MNQTSASQPGTSQQDKAVTEADLMVILLGLLAMYVPTVLKLSDSIWKIIGQGHGPVILALTVWLVWQRIPAFLQSTGTPVRVSAALVLAAGLLAYVVGHSQDLLFLDVGSMLLVLSGICLFLKGWSGMRVMLFPIFFLIFLVPIPGSIVDGITAPLKAGVSHVAEQALYMAGYPIGRTGVTLTIGPYHLLVADACAGLNSIFALEAVGVFYMSLMQYQSKLRNTVLALLILPISFVSNVVRVIVLVLVTYYFGDEVGQGFVHDFAGVFLFVLASILTILTDSFLGLFFKDKGQTPTGTPLKAA
jgi:exosortase B